MFVDESTPCPEFLPIDIEVHGAHELWLRRAASMPGAIIRYVTMHNIDLAEFARITAETNYTKKLRVYVTAAAYGDVRFRSDKWDFRIMVKPRTEMCAFKEVMKMPRLPDMHYEVQDAHKLAWLAWETIGFHIYDPPEQNLQRLC